MSDELTEKELVDIERRAAAARSSPWISFIEGRDHLGGSSMIQVGTGSDRSADIELTGATVEDQDFIAAAREDVPRLIRYIRLLKRQVDK